MSTNYELLYIIPAKYTEEELVPIQDTVREQIIKSGGKIFFEDNLGKKRMAYPIEKTNQGYYLLAEFGLEPDKLNNLNSNLKLTDELLRHIIVKKKERSEKEIVRAAKKFATPAVPLPSKEKMEKDQEVKKSTQGKDDDKDKVKLEDLDKKLDELIDTDIL